MSQSNKRSFEPRRSEYRPLNAAPQGRPLQRPPQARPVPQRPQQPRPAAARPAQPGPARPAPQRPVQARGSEYRPLNRLSFAHRREKAGLPHGFAGLLIACAVLLAVCIGLQFVFPSGIHLAANAGETMASQSMVSQIYANGPVRINEIMTSNQRTLALADGSSPDWIEITNTGNHSVNLKDYSLSKTADSVSIFTFPDMSLEPGGCLLLYADSKLSETVEKEMHVPFRLSSAGDTLMLFNAGRTAIDTVNIPAIGGDHSYVRVDNSHWEVGDKPTPGAANTEENHLAMKQKTGYSPVAITEIMAVNDSAYAAQDEMYYDYIELCNTSSETVSLGGWYLSDDPEYTRKWRIPDGTSVAPGEYIIIFASGLDMREDLEQLHAGFSLSSEGETIVLCDGSGRIMDMVSFDLMKSNIAYALQADGTWENTTATPGAAN